MGRNGQILRVSVIGTGYLGLTHAVCMADLGHEVLAIDVDADKIAMAARGETPFFEPGLEPSAAEEPRRGQAAVHRLLRRDRRVRRRALHLRRHAPGEGRRRNADLSYVFGAAEALAPHLNRATLSSASPPCPSGRRGEIIARVHAAAPAGDLVELRVQPRVPP